MMKLLIVLVYSLFEGEKCKAQVTDMYSTDKEVRMWYINWDLGNFEKGNHRRNKKCNSLC